MSPLMLLVLEPDAPGDAAFAVGLATWNKGVSHDSADCLQSETYGSYWRNVDMLYSLLGLNGSIDSGSSGSYKKVSGCVGLQASPRIVYPPLQPDQEQLSLYLLFPD